MPVFMIQDVGTVFEIAPVLGADDSKMDVSFSFEHHTAPPDQKMTQIVLPNSEKGIENWRRVGWLGGSASKRKSRWMGCNSGRKCSFSWWWMSNYVVWRASSYVWSATFFDSK